METADRQDCESFAPDRWLNKRELQTELGVSEGVEAKFISPSLALAGCIY
jgi:hypothetical protein